MKILLVTSCLLQLVTFVIKCMSMKKEYKEKYDDTNKLILPNYRRVEHRQIHCILNHFDNRYKKLTNSKDKKNYLKDIVDKSKVNYHHYIYIHKILE